MSKGNAIVGQSGGPTSVITSRARKGNSFSGNFPSEAFLDYLRPLVGELPEYADLRFGPVG